MGRGEIIQPVATRIREVGSVGEALAAASVELRERESALRESEQRLRLAIDVGRMAVWDHDVPDGRIILFPELNQLFGFPAEASPTLRDVQARYAPGEADRLSAETLHALNRGERYIKTELHTMLPDGQHRWHLIRNLLLTNRNGALSRELGVLVDITGRKRSEEHQQLLVNELNHRVKNTLATVQSITSQSLRSASTQAKARESIEARLFALSRVHNLLNRESWEGADMTELVAEALGPHMAGGENRIEATGPKARLLPRMALPLAMTLQELTNAVKHGALSNNGGKVHVHRLVRPEGHWQRLHLTWTESNGPAVETPTRRGFGTRLIERSLASELGGEVRITFAAEGIVCTMDFPIEKD